MSAGPGSAEAQSKVTAIEFFRASVQRLLHDNLDFVLSDSIGPRRNVEVLHLIDQNPQPGTTIDLHIVYEAFDAIRQIRTHGIYLANPWPRQIFRKRPEETARESRHYFESSEDLVVRQDSRMLTPKGHGLLRGLPVEPLEVTELADAVDLLDLREDIERINSSTPVKVASIAFNKFARRT